MKKIVILLLALWSPVFACNTPTVTPAAIETKKVCIKVYDAAQKKDVEKCSTVTIRKKQTGTPIKQNQ